jgi:hypothetical protein
MEWQPTSVEAVKRIVEGDLKTCDSKQVAVFEKYSVKPYRAPILRYGKMESVVVVAQRRNDVIYWEDVEGGFNCSAIGPDGRILEHLCNQNDLRLALNKWIGGEGSITLVWVFTGARTPTSTLANFPGGVFSSIGIAEDWIKLHCLSGTLTLHRMDAGAYDWALANGDFKPSKPHHYTPEFIGQFSGGDHHHHYESGMKVA